VVTTFLIIQTNAQNNYQYECNIHVKAPTATATDDINYDILDSISRFNSDPQCPSLSKFAPTQTLGDSPELSDCNHDSPFQINASTIETPTQSSVCEVCNEFTYEVHYNFTTDKEISDAETEIYDAMVSFNGTAEKIVTLSTTENHIKELKQAIGGTMDVDYDLIHFMEVSCKSAFVVPAKIGCLFRPGGDEVDPFSPNTNDQFRTFNVNQTSTPFNLADLRYMREINNEANIEVIIKEDVKQGYQECANLLIDKTNYFPDKFFTALDLEYAEYIISETWTPSGINFGTNLLTYHAATPAQRNAIFSTLGYYDASASPYP
jgi:hypothetical protein